MPQANATLPGGDNATLPSGNNAILYPARDGELRGRLDTAVLGPGLLSSSLSPAAPGVGTLRGGGDLAGSTAGSLLASHDISGSVAGTPGWSLAVSAPASGEGAYSLSLAAPGSGELRNLSSLAAAAGGQSHAEVNVFTPGTLHAYLRTVPSGTFSYVGKLTTSPLSLGALANGEYEVRVARGEWFWEEALCPEQVTRFRVPDTDAPATPDTPEVTQAGESTFLVRWWFQEHGLVEPTGFRLWTGAASPVTVTGDPDETVGYFGEGWYQATVTRETSGYVAVRAYTATAESLSVEAAVIPASDSLTGPASRGAQEA